MSCNEQQPASRAARVRPQTLVQGAGQRRLPARFRCGASCDLRLIPLRSGRILLREPLGRNVHAPDRTRAFARAMPIGPTAANDAEEIRQRSETLDVFLIVTWMPHLDTIEPQRHERLDPLPSPIAAGMRPDRERTGRVSDLDRIADLESLLFDEARPAGSQISVEGFARIANSADSDQCARDV